MAALKFALAGVFLSVCSHGATVTGIGTNTPAGYVPAMLSNGHVCFTTDFLGGVPTKAPKTYASPGIFISGRRMLYGLYSHGTYRLKLSVEGKQFDVPDRWSQTLEQLTAMSTVTNVFGSLTRVAETFVSSDKDVIAVRQTFSGVDPTKVEAGIEYSEPKSERLVGNWEETTDGKTFAYVAYGRKVDRGRITIRNAREEGSFVTFISYGKPYTGTYSELAAAHKSTWQKYYSTSSVSIPDERLMQLRLMAEYQLKCNVTPWTLPVGIFPSHWNGNSFAFDELYGMQGLLSSGHFEEARHIADFRFATLKQAQRRVMGKGARWYWECMEDTVREGAPSGHWLDHIFHMSAIAQTCNLAASYLDDIDYLSQKAYPVMRECARFFRSQKVYDAPDGTSFVAKCTDLERLGAAKERPCMTTCGIIHTFRICADAAAKLGVDAEEAADWRATAERLVKSLPVKDGRFVPAANAQDAVSMGTLAGYFPFPIFPKGHPEQTASVDYFLAQGARAGNMYKVGKKICPWYAATMAMAALRAGEGEKVYPLIKTAADVAGVWGEYWEINEPGVAELKPWFMTAAGNCLYAMNQMLLMEADGELRIGAGVPQDWKDWSFRLPAESGYEVDFAMKDGQIVRLELRDRKDTAGHLVKIVLPDGVHKTAIVKRL